MNTNINRIAIVFLFIFALIIVRLTQLHIFDAGELTSSKENKRLLVKEVYSPRGKILSSDGISLAESKPDGDRYIRAYPLGSTFAHVVGFYNLTYGKSGAEAAYHSALSSKASNHLIKRIIGNTFGGSFTENIILTLDSRLQKTASQLLDNRKGAIVVMNPKNGNILAMYSNPSFDPNRIDKDWKELSASPDSPLIFRASQGLYPPGSMMKIVTAATALAYGIDKNSVWDGPRELRVSGGKVTNYADQASGTMTLKEAMIKSSNTVFANIGLKLSGERLIGSAMSFGFNSKPNVDFPMSKSRIVDASKMDDLELAWTAVGQGRTLVSPVHMAMIISAIANQGIMPTPNILEKIEMSEVIDFTNERASKWRTVINENISKEVEEMLVGVVEVGTGKNAKIDNFIIAGKTGTAETNEGLPHSWFGGYGPVGNPKVAVVVLIENGGSGGKVAAPIAKKIFEKALELY